MDEKGNIENKKYKNINLESDIPTEKTSIISNDNKIDLSENNNSIITFTDKKINENIDE